MIILWNKLKSGKGGDTPTVSGSNLNDIKTMAQAIAEKGWAFQCKSTRQDLPKSLVPTLYNDILDKLNNSEKQLQPMTQLSLNGYRVLYSSTLNKWFYTNQSKVYETNNLIFSNVFLNDNISEMICGNNIFVSYVISGSNSGKYVIVNLNNNEIKYITLSSNIPLNSGAIRSIVKDGYIYVCSVNRSDFTKIYKFYDDFSITDFETITFSKNIYDIQYDNGYWYVLLADGVYKGTDINNPNDFTRIYQTEIYNSSFLIVKDNFSCFLRGRNWPIKYTYDLYQNVSQTGNNFDISYPSNINSYPKLLNNIIWTTQNMSIDINDFSTDTTVYDIKGLDIDYNNNTVVFGSSNNMYVAGFVNKQYTDTYIVNGNSVVINYYKYNDFKICLADGGTNDTNLATVYSYMGYYNYFVLDTTGETVSLPRNSNLYSMMYVGDNYQDTTAGITGNATRLLPQSEVISDSSATVSLDIKGNKDYQLTASALTSLTISSCEVSDLETVLYFTTGGTISFTDSSSLKWGGDGSAPSLEANTIYCISIRNGLAEIDTFGTVS